MHKLKYLAIFSILMMLLSLSGPSFGVSARPLGATSPSLGAAETYLVLAGSIVTNSGNTTVAGDVGVSPSIGIPPHVTGFPPGIVSPPGAIHDADAHAAAAQAANTAAFGALDQICDNAPYPPGVQDLGGLSLVPGVYCADAWQLTGNLTLVGTTGVWIFKSASTLITAAGSSVTGGDPCNLWWRVVSSATIGVNSRFMGNILALTSIALQTNASLGGRALAQTGAVTLNGNTISYPVCAAVPTKIPTKTPTGIGLPTFIPTNIVLTIGPILTKLAKTPKPAITSLPNTGGAPIRNEDFPWSLVVVAGFSAIALVLGVRAFRRGHLPKQ
jgi:Ice-binding-like